MAQAPLLPIQSIARWLYFAGAALAILWLARRFFALGEVPLWWICVPAFLYTSLLAHCVTRMRPTGDRTEAFIALHGVLVLPHALGGLVALAGLAAASQAPCGLGPGWAVSLSMGGIVFGAIASQIVFVYAHGAAAYSRTCIGMLLYLIGCILVR